MTLMAITNTFTPNQYFHSQSTPTQPFSQGVVQLSIAFGEETDDHVQAAIAWSLGQIGRHTPEHAKAVAVANVLPRLLYVHLMPGASEDLQAKVHIVYW